MDDGDIDVFPCQDDRHVFHPMRVWGLVEIQPKPPIKLEYIFSDVQSAGRMGWKGREVLSHGSAQSGCSPVANNEQ